MIAFASIFLAIVIFFGPLALHIFNISYYNKLYTENNVFEDLNENDVEKITLDIFDFFKYDGDLNGSVRYANPLMSSVKFFTDNEIGHMEDVRELLKNILILFTISLAGFLILFIILIFTDKKNNLRKTGPVFLWASAIVLLLFLALYIMSLNFSYLFEQFHVVFFPQGNYMFSADSLLLTLFPFGFFYQYFLRLIICSSIGAALSAAIGIVFIIVQKKHERRYKIEK